MIDIDELYEEFDDEDYHVDKHPSYLYRKLQRGSLNKEAFYKFSPSQQSAFLLFIANKLKSILKLGLKTHNSLNKRDKVRFENIMKFIGQVNFDQSVFVFFMFDDIFLSQTGLNNHPTIKTIIDHINKLN